MTFKRGDIIRTVTKSGYMREGGDCFKQLE